MPRRQVQKSFPRIGEDYQADLPPIPSGDSADISQAENSSYRNHVVGLPVQLTRPVPGTDVARNIVNGLVPGRASENCICVLLQAIVVGLQMLLEAFNINHFSWNQVPAFERLPTGEAHVTLPLRKAQSKEPEGSNHNSISFLASGVKKLLRNELFKGQHYFDSATDIIVRMAMEPDLTKPGNDGKEPDDGKDRKQKKVVDDDYVPPKRKRCRTSDAESSKGPISEFGKYCGRLGHLDSNEGPSYAPSSDQKENYGVHSMINLNEPPSEVQEARSTAPSLVRADDSDSRSMIDLNSLPPEAQTAQSSAPSSAQLAEDPSAGLMIDLNNPCPEAIEVDHDLARREDAKDVLIIDLNVPSAEAEEAEEEEGNPTVEEAEVDVPPAEEAEEDEPPAEEAGEGNQPDEEAGEDDPPPQEAGEAEPPAQEAEEGNPPAQGEEGNPLVVPLDNNNVDVVEVNDQVQIADPPRRSKRNRVMTSKAVEAIARGYLKVRKTRRRGR